MNSKKIKNKVAISCNGDLKRYFQKVEQINKMIYKNKLDIFKNKRFLNELINN